MLMKKQDIITLQVQNKLFHKKGIGTLLSAYMIGFDGSKYIYGSVKREYITNPITKTKFTSRNDIHIKSPEIGIYRPFENMPNIISLKSGILEYMIDVDTNYICDNYPFIRPNLAHFLKSQKKFNAKSTNAVYVLPMNTGIEFINDVIDYASAQNQMLFAKNLALFAEDKATCLQKTR